MASGVPTEATGPEPARPGAPGPRPEQAPARRHGPGRPAIEGYALEEVLGRGAMGTVYRARQLSVDREVALKILHPELVARPRVVERMRREARMTARLAHPHLVSAVDMGTFEGRLWYAMEFVDGPTLSLRLRQEGRLPEREALRLFIPLCEALDHLGEHGIVHRDVKPANILLDKKGGARLADLGLAFADADPEITKHGGTLGTPQYISPEQAIDPTKADARSDLWSFGATMFHGVCGRPPFVGESTAEVLSAVLYERVPDPRELEPALSKGLALVLRKCLAREPEARYQSPRELLADLERVRERRQPRVRRSGLDPVASQVDRRPLYLALAALALVLAGLGLGRLGPWREGRARAQAEEVAVERTSPLVDALERRVLERIGTPGSLLRQHAVLGEELPASMRPRWLALGDAVRTLVGEAIDGLARSVQVDVQGALAAGDHVGAHALLTTGLEQRLVGQLGFERGELLRALPEALDWVEPLQERVDATEAETLARLRRALEDQRAELEREVADRLEQQRWAQALALLEFDSEALLEEAGFADHTFRADQVEAALVALRTWTKIQRDRIGDRWRDLDRELRRAVVARAEHLRAELAGSGPSFSAAGELFRYFDQELSEQRLALDSRPTSLPFTAYDALEREMTALREIEDARLEAELRAAVELAAREAESAWRARDVALVRARWEEVQERLRRPGGLAGTDWRAELELEVAGRLLEVRLVDELLRRAADEVTARSGSRVDLRLRGVKYADRLLYAGGRVLEQGVRLEGLDGNVRLQELSARELSRLADLEAPGRLDDRERVGLAALLQHDGEARASLALLRVAPVGESPELERLALDLAVRATDVLERAEAGPADDVGRRVEAVLDGGSLRDDPEALRAELAALLADHAEDPAVVARRAELEARLAAAATPAPSGPTALRPAELERLRGGGLALRFDFTRADPGAWRADGWFFDGLGWIHSGDVATLPQVAARAGLTLPLAPLEPLTGPLTVRFDVELPADAGPGRLLVVEVDGVFVALVGERLPGAPGRARVVVETAGLHALLERAQDPGEGREVPGLLEPGERRVLEIRVGPRRGRVDVSLGGEPLVQDRQVRSPNEPRHVLSLRAWEPLRLYGVELVQ